MSASFARGTAVRQAALSGLAAVTSSARSAIVGKLQLAARAEARSFARGGITAAAPLVAIAGRTLIKFAARALLYAFANSPRVGNVPAEMRSADARGDRRSVVLGPAPSSFATYPAPTGFNWAFITSGGNGVTSGGQPVVSLVGN
jgi:hypothetical protein